jgi:excisionase family DNA binding protein
MRLNPLTIQPMPPLAWATVFHGYTRTKPNEPNSDSTAVPTMLTIQEACAALRVSKWTIYQLIRSRQLATIKIGSRRVVPLAAIQALLKRLQEEEVT